MQRKPQDTSFKDAIGLEQCGKKGGLSLENLDWERLQYKTQ